MAEKWFEPRFPLPWRMGITRLSGAVSSHFSPYPGVAPRTRQVLVPRGAGHLIAAR